MTARSPLVRPRDRMTAASVSCAADAQRASAGSQIDCGWFPGEMTIAFDPEDGSGEIVVPGGRSISFDGVSSVYWRNYDGAYPSKCRISAHSIRAA
jgi:hypothetical protein